jgi:hypothetical protein
MRPSLKAAAEYEIAAIERLLSHAIGEEAAAQAVRACAIELGLPTGRPLSREQALILLEKIAETPGIVGVTARFAKSRLHMAKS